MRIIFTKNKYNEWEKVSVNLTTPIPTITKLKTSIFEKKFGYSEKTYKNSVEGLNLLKLSTVKKLLIPHDNTAYTLLKH